MFFKKIKINFGAKQTKWINELVSLSTNKCQQLLWEIVIELAWITPCNV